MHHRLREKEQRYGLSILFSLRFAEKLSREDLKGKSFNPLFIEVRADPKSMDKRNASFNPLFIEISTDQTQPATINVKLSILFSLSSEGKALKKMFTAFILSILFSLSSMKSLGWTSIMFLSFNPLFIEKGGTKSSIYSRVWSLSILFSLSLSSGKKSGWIEMVHFQSSFHWALIFGNWAKYEYKILSILFSLSGKIICYSFSNNLRNLSILFSLRGCGALSFRVWIHNRFQSSFHWGLNDFDLCSDFVLSFQSSFHWAL